MKFFLFAILLGLSSGIFAQSLQLDSIIFRDAQSGQKKLKYSFRYEDNRLSEFRENDSDLILINYDDSGKFSELPFIFDGDHGSLDFKYNSNNQIDTMIINYQAGMNSPYDIIYDFQYENDTLSSILFSYVENTLNIFYFRRTYSYYDNSLKITDFDVTYSMEDLLGSEEYLFDDQKRLSHIMWSSKTNSVIQIDTFLYDENQSLLGQYKIPYTDGIPGDLNLENEYSSDISINFDNILNPSEFFKILLLENSDDEYASVYYPMIYGNKVDQQTQFADAEMNIGWYYSALVANENTRVNIIPISVYPNPTMDLLKIESNDATVHFTIYNINGAIVKTGISESNLVTVSELAIGNYTIVCSNKQGQYYFAQFTKY